MFNLDGSENFEKREFIRNQNITLVKAGYNHFKPILMAMHAMVIAMIPIAFATGAGAEWKNGLALVLVGGLLSSLIFTIIIVPIMFVVIDSWKGDTTRADAKKCPMKH